MIRWSLHFDAMYGSNNRQRGLNFAYHRLIEEVLKAQGTQLVDLFDQSLSQLELRQRIAHKFADVIAWTLSVANLLEINLEEVIKSYYGTICRRCKKPSCECGPYYRYRIHSDPHSQVSGK